MWRYSCTFIYFKIVREQRKLKTFLLGWWKYIVLMLYYCAHEEGSSFPDILKCPYPLSKRTAGEGYWSKRNCTVAITCPPISSVLLPSLPLTIMIYQRPESFLSVVLQCSCIINIIISTLLLGVDLMREVWKKLCMLSCQSEPLRNNKGQRQQSLCNILDFLGRWILLCMRQNLWKNVTSW